jgi:hypothetical protein
MAAKLSVLQAMILDGLAEGKTPRQLEAVTGVPAAEVFRMGNELLDQEINLDVASKRALQVYRLEKIIEALYQRVMKNADRDDVKNLIEVMDRINDLLALHKERDADELLRVTQYQSSLYIASLKQLINAFKIIAPNIMRDDEWELWIANELDIARSTLERNSGQLELTEDA